MVNNNWIKNSLVLGFFLPFLLSAQKVPYRTVYWKFDAHFGYIIEHRSNLGHLVQSHIFGAELTAALPSSGRCKWECENNFPEKGISLSWFNLGNPKQLGDLFGIAPHFEIPLKARPVNTRLYLRMGAGLAFATKYFDPITNHKNNVLSAPVNGFVNFKFLFKKEIGNKHRIDFGFSLAHASNGKVKVPNLGINLGTIDVAFVFKTPPKQGAEREFQTYIDSSQGRPSKHELYYFSSIGFTAIYPVDHRRFFTTSQNIGYYLNVRNTHKWGLGFDIFYNPANKIQSLIEDSLVVSTAQNFQYGAKISWAYNIGRFSFPVEVGYYLKTTFKDDGFIYNRIGIRYYTKRNIAFSVMLKSHFARADYFEYGIGYRFPLKKKNENN
jgi:hypothetical protein